MEDGHNDNALWENQLMRNSKNEVPNFPCHAIGEAMCSVEESNLSDSDFFFFLWLCWVFIAARAFLWLWWVGTIL